jgi:hypothetical protein
LKGAWLAILLVPPLILALTGLVGAWRNADGTRGVPLLAEAARARGVDSAVRINVRWAPAVTPELRAGLEVRYGLSDGEPLSDDPRKRTWRYDVSDTSTSNIEALVKDESHVEDTSGIDRAHFTIIEKPGS